MKKLLSGIALSAFLAAPAMAADIPVRMPVKAPPPVVTVYSWTGCYIGAHGGGAWGNKRFRDPITGTDFDFAEHDVNGFLIGGQIGCNYQTGQWVFGIEGNAAWANVDGDVTGTGTIPFFGPLAASFNTDINVLGNIAGRIGWAFDRTLIYAKGGLAFANERHFVNVGGVEVLGTDRELRWGWMVGGGLEYAFNNNWSGLLEYNYNRFQNDDIQFCTPAAALCGNVDTREHIHVFKVGINYRWGGGPVVARY